MLERESEREKNSERDRNCQKDRERGRSCEKECECEERDTEKRCTLSHCFIISSLSKSFSVINFGLPGGRPKIFEHREFSKLW